MKTTSVLAVFGAGVAAASTMSGCGIIGGCGAPDDPTNVSTFVATATDNYTMTAPVLGIAAAPNGVWTLTGVVDDALLTEYDHLGGQKIAAMQERFQVTPVGLAWDGSALWFGGTDAGGAAIAIRRDQQTSRQMSLSNRPVLDLAWNGSSLITVDGNPAFQSIDATTGTLLFAVPVQRINAVSAVAYHDGETWLAYPGKPVLIYGDDGILLATANVDAVATATADVHMTFIGDELVVASGTSVTTYAIDRTQPTPGV